MHGNKRKFATTLLRQRRDQTPKGVGSEKNKPYGINIYRSGIYITNLPGEKFRKKERKKKEKKGEKKKKEKRKKSICAKAQNKTKL